MTTDKTKEIAELNDLFRMDDGLDLGRKVHTDGIASLPLIDQFIIMQRVSDYEDFTEDNNPHGERDFGAFDHAGQRIVWKIDYYNLTLDGGSEDPSDPAKTIRVLTTMLAREY